MDADQAVELARTAIILTLKLSLPVLIVATVTGLLISMLQAVTQIQDQTLSFVPKIILMLITTLVVFPWAIAQIVEYSSELITNIPGTI